MSEDIKMKDDHKVPMGKIIAIDFEKETITLKMNNDARIPLNENVYLERYTSSLVRDLTASNKALEVAEKALDKANRKSIHRIGC